MFWNSSSLLENSWLSKNHLPFVRHFTKQTSSSLCKLCYRVDTRNHNPPQFYEVKLEIGHWPELCPARLLQTEFEKTLSLFQE